MGDVLKNAAVIAGVLLLSAVIYFVVSDNQPLREDVFDRSLNLLGQQLLTLLPDDQAREVVESRWKKIAERAGKGEIPPEQVERMAVGILNASNMDKEISVEDAEIILNLAYEVPEPMTVEEPKQPEVNAIAERASIRKMSHEALQKKLHQIGKNIETVCEFNTKIKNSCETDPTKRKIFVRNFRYEISNGIRLNADMNLKHELNSQNFHAWKLELKRLEEERLLDWKQNFADELATQEATLQAHLDSLHSVIAVYQTQAMQHKIEIITKELVELEKIGKLQQWQVVNPTVVQKVSVKSPGEPEAGAKSTKVAAQQN